MARSNQANRAIARKVELLMNEGFDLKQAQAIAFRMYRDGELRISRAPSRPRRRGNNFRKVKTAAKLLGLAKILRGK